MNKLKVGGARLVHCDAFTEMRWVELINCNRRGGRGGERRRGEEPDSSIFIPWEEMKEVGGGCSSHDSRKDARDDSP